MYDFQKILLLLYTNDAFAAKMKNNPDEAFAGFDLTEREKDTVLKIPTQKLDEFRGSLQSKRRSVLRSILSKGNFVTLVAFWHDSPAIAWGAETAPRVLPISEGVARMLKELSMKGEILTLPNIFKARMTATEKVSLRDVVSFVRIAINKRLIGKEVFASL